MRVTGQVDVDGGFSLESRGSMVLGLRVKRLTAVVGIIGESRVLRDESCAEGMSNIVTRTFVNH